MFVEFDSPEEATNAINTLDGLPFDAKHTFLLNRLTDVDKFADMDETYVEPELEEYAPKVGSDPCSQTFRFDSLFINS